MTDKDSALQENNEDADYLPWEHVIFVSVESTDALLGLIDDGQVLIQQLDVKNLKKLLQFMMLISVL